MGFETYLAQGNADFTKRRAGVDLETFAFYNPVRMETNPYLYVTDLDGTLLNEDGLLSHRTRNGLVALLERGVPITIASARSHFSISQIFGDVPFKLPIIEFNGAFLTDYRTGEHLEMNALSTELGHRVLDVIDEFGFSPFVSSYNGSEDCLHYSEIENGAMRWYEARRRRAGDPRLRQTRDLRSTMSEAVVSLTIMGEHAAPLLSLKEELERRFTSELALYFYENAYFLGTYWLTIHQQRANKKTAISSLRRRLGYDAKVVALGDNVNDIEMLKAADRAVAVENAVPELLALAHHVIAHHATDSVIEFIEAETRRGWAGDVA